MSDDPPSLRPQLVDAGAQAGPAAAGSPSISGETPQKAAEASATAEQSAPAATDDQERLDRLMHAWQARFTQSISPPALRVALTDWASHLANAPGRRAELSQEAAQMLARLVFYALAKRANGETALPVEPSAGDRRFSDPGWRESPFDLIHQ